MNRSILLVFTLMLFTAPVLAMWQGGIRKKTTQLSFAEYKDQKAESRLLRHKERKCQERWDTMTKVSSIYAVVVANLTMGLLLFSANSQRLGTHEFIMHNATHNVTVVHNEQDPIAQMLKNPVEFHYHHLITIPRKPPVDPDEINLKVLKNRRK